MHKTQSCPSIKRTIQAAALMITYLLTIPLNAADNTPPNFIFILGEGLGWTSTSVQLDPNIPESKSDFFPTPNLERLAATGMRFSRFYAPSPRCTPSRATYFTGISPTQLHMTFVNNGADPARKIIGASASTEMPAEVTTIPELLKPLGYATAHFGKWHVGRRLSPADHGFDENDGSTSNGGPENVDNANPKEAYGMTERGIDFMTRQTRAGKPFYLQVSHYPGRGESGAKPETLQKLLDLTGGQQNRNTGAAAISLDMDITIGLILDKLDELGIADNTYVYYTTDHGTPGGSSNPPLKSGKGTIWEGGLRVPMFFRGPGIKPNSHSDVLTTGADFLSTVAELANVKQSLPKEIEGGSLVPLLKNNGVGQVNRPREEYVVHFPHYDLDNTGPATSIVLGDFKLIRVYETGKSHLFNLVSDMGERNDLADTMPQKVAELDGLLSSYLSSVDAQMPTPNPNYDPNAPVADRRGGGQRAGRGGGGGGGRGGEQNRPDPIFTAIDTDADGSISIDELQAVPNALRKLDTNKDGQISADELNPRGGGGGGGNGGGGGRRDTDGSQQPN